MVKCYVRDCHKTATMQVVTEETKNETITFDCCQRHADEFPTGSKYKRTPLT